MFADNKLFEMIWDLMCKFPAITCCFIYFGILGCLVAYGIFRKFCIACRYIEPDEDDSITLKIRIVKEEGKEEDKEEDKGV